MSFRLAVTVTGIVTFVTVLLILLVTFGWFEAPPPAKPSCTGMWLGDEPPSGSVRSGPTQMPARSAVGRCGSSPNHMPVHDGFAGGGGPSTFFEGRVYCAIVFEGDDTAVAEDWLRACARKIRGGTDAYPEPW